MFLARKRAFARAGLLGNPSDGYHGKTISMSVRNYWAEVVLYEWDSVDIVLSHDDRTRIMADEHRSRVTLKNLQVRATFLVDGFVAGTWKSERKRKAAVLLIEPFGAVAKKTRAALEQEGELLLEFLEEDATEREVRWAS